MGKLRRIIEGTALAVNSFLILHAAETAPPGIFVVDTPDLIENAQTLTGSAIQTKQLFAEEWTLSGTASASIPRS